MSRQKHAAKIRAVIGYSTARTFTGTPEYAQHKAARDSLAALVSVAEKAEALAAALSNIEAMAYDGVHHDAIVLAAIQCEASSTLAAFGSGEGDTT